MVMKPFYQIAIPHDDIKEGKFTLDTFAADLWSVYQNRGPEEYRNPELFWERTYETNGLKNLLEIARKRLIDGVGDAIIQLQTPFGGGKTHSLIALYHKAREWNAKVVVLDGTVFDAKETKLWEEMEKQLTNKVEITKGDTSPGKAKIMKLLEENKPVMILVDELLEYMVKASGVKVGETTLADQTLAFIHELTEAVKATDKVILVMTLPSSILEHYSEKAEEYFQKLQKIAGRSQRVFTPVQEDEVTDVIRRRLFKRVDEDEIKNIVDEIVKYLDKENLIPEGLNAYQYKQKFLKSYPFQPEVIDVLYHRWGSLPKFQRTRGVLRLLSLVIYTLMGKEIPFIRLADFDLSVKDIRDELIDIIGESRYYSVIDADITSQNSGAKKVDKMLGESYENYKIGTKASTVIFMYSFSGSHTKGATTKEIKLSCADLRYSSSIVGEAILHLENNLLYLHKKNGKYFFSTKPNIRKLVIDEMSNIGDEEIKDIEAKLLKHQLKKLFNTYLWPEKSKDIPDNEKLKLVILREHDKDKILQIIQSYGDGERVYKNTLIFLVPRESERTTFNRLVREYLAWNKIYNRAKKGSLEVTSDEKEEIRNNIKRLEEDLKQKIVELYRIVITPKKDGYDEIDLGIRPIGVKKTIDEIIHEKLKEENKLLEKMDPRVIELKYLNGKDYIFTKLLYESHLKTPGMSMLKDKSVIVSAIQQGVEEGRFGLGYINEEICCKYLGEKAKVTLDDNEIIIRKDFCEILKDKEKERESGKQYTQEVIYDEKVSNKIIQTETTTPSISIEETKERDKKEKESETIEESIDKNINSIHLQLTLEPGIGGLREIISILKLLTSRFKKVTLDIKAEEGSISQIEYENILETFRQSNIIAKEKHS
ncbi:conserved protein of unknown function [Methanocaldococcus lauensis]|uniref:Uncharacterized protein n=1 Tax=Methanocaldococcus lauensis TaxID=2546128 RepID=A0A8D6PY50_9EURY|nr:DUF499 domain-containing protein [Methanocaldococcus lauensis]CAB3288037.1 conserved protein of unknown function [Methanocaldococcus lauensis]